jgi:hypothetical protein
MKTNLCGLFFGLLVAGVVLAIRPAHTAEPQWIDPEILRKLQGIESIDRSKLKPNVARLISKYSENMAGARITQGDGKTIVPEVGERGHGDVFIVKGKTKSPMNINGLSFPAGLDREAVYDSKGNLLRETTEMPTPTSLPDPSRRIFP